MNTKQVFWCYDKETESKLNFPVYCSICGTKYVEKELDGMERKQCPKCSYIHYMNPVPAVSVLIADKRGILLCKRKKNTVEGDKWCLPCGYIEYGEDFLSAAYRETVEETGLCIEIKSIINVVSNFISESVHSLVIVVLAEVKSGTALAGDDVEEVRWYDGSEVLPELAFKADEYIIDRYYKSKIQEISIDTSFMKRQIE